MGLFPATDIDPEMQISWTSSSLTSLIQFITAKRKCFATPHRPYPVEHTRIQKGSGHIIEAKGK